MININNLIRENIKNISGYSTARDEYKGNIGVFLDANENSFGSVPKGKYNRYPDPHQFLIKEKISNQKGVSSENIFIGNGSDEAIDLLFRVFCTPGKDSVITMPPTYGMYKVAAKINDITVEEVPLNKNFEIDIDSVLNKCSDKTKIIFICSPNNPTGNLLSKEAIFKILSSFNGLVVVDEAYIDFADSESWISELGSFNNLVVLQTFSKAWGLANIRVGLAFGDKKIISLLNKIKYPYNVNGVSQAIIAEALDNTEKKDSYVRKIINEKDYLKTALSKFNFVEKVFHSDANFLLVKVANAKAIYNYLLENQIIVRDRSDQINCEECLRFTVGTGIENKKTIEILSKYED